MVRVPTIEMSLEEKRQVSGLERWDEGDILGSRETEDLTWGSLMELRRLNTRRYIGCAKHAYTTSGSDQRSQSNRKHTGDSPADGIKPPSAIEYTYESERQHASEAMRSKAVHPVR